MVQSVSALVSTHCFARFGSARNGGTRYPSLGLGCMFTVHGNSLRCGIYNKKITTELRRRSIVYNLDYKTLEIQDIHASLSKLTWTLAQGGMNLDTEHTICLTGGRGADLLRVLSST